MIQPLQRDHEQAPAKVTDFGDMGRLDPLTSQNAEFLRPEQVVSVIPGRLPCALSVSGALAPEGRSEL